MLDEVTQRVLACKELQAWPDLEKILAKRKPGTLALFKIAYTTAGNTSVDALPIQAALVCFIINCILLDDVLDEDEKGLWKTYGVGRTANLAAALHARQQVLVFESEFSDPQKQAVILYLNQMMLLEAQAQELATQNRLDLSQYWAIVHGKSGNVCGTSMRLGAFLGGASPSEVETLYSIGQLMGEVGQISNDLRGAFQTPANPDWTWTGSSLPILLALTAPHPYADEFKTLLAGDLNQNGHLERAQKILVESKTVSLCCDHISQRLEKIYQALCRCGLSGKKHLHQNIGEDILHAIRWIRDLEVDLSEETQKTLGGLEQNLAAGTFL